MHPNESREDMSSWFPTSEEIIEDKEWKKVRMPRF